MNKTKDAYFYVDYEEFEPETFKGFIVNMPDNTKIRFDGRRPVPTFKKFLEWFDKQAAGNSDFRVNYLSSIDNFLMDSKNKRLAALVYGPNTEPTSENLMNCCLKKQK